MTKTIYLIEGCEKITENNQFISGETIYRTTAKTLKAAKNKAEKILKNKDCYSVWIVEEINEIQYSQWSKYDDSNKWYTGEINEKDF